MIFLPLETFENKLVHNISRYSKNHVLTVKPLRKVNFFAQLNFFQDSCFLFLHTNKILKVSGQFVENIQHWPTTLIHIYSKMLYTQI